jgi:hypothetical protein
MASEGVHHVELSKNSSTCHRDLHYLGDGKRRKSEVVGEKNESSKEKKSPPQKVDTIRPVPSPCFFD